MNGWNEGDGGGLESTQPGIGGEQNASDDLAVP